MDRIIYIKSVFKIKYIIAALLTIIGYLLLCLADTFVPIIYEKILKTFISMELNAMLFCIWIVADIVIVIAKRTVEYLNSIINLELFGEMHDYLCEKYFNFGSTEIKEKGAGYFSNLLTFTGKKVADLFLIANLQSVFKLFTVILMIIVIFTRNYACGLLSVLFVAAVVFLARRGNHLYMNWAGDYQTDQLKLFSFCRDIIRGAGTIRLFKKQKYMVSRFDERNSVQIESSIKAGTRDFKYFFVYIDGLRLIYSLSIMGIAFNAAYSGASSIATSLLIIYYSELIGQPILELAFALDNIRDSLTAIDVIKESTDNMCDRTEVECAYNIRDIEQVRFEKICFKNQDNSILMKDFNCIVQKGGVYYLSADSGKGKTSLLNALLGLRKDYAGEILINGCDVRNIDIRSLYNNIGMLLQKAHIFKGSIKENICMGDMSDMNLYKRMIEIMDIAYLEGRLISEETISGGEKSRVLLARCLYQGRNKNFLIFDEPLEGVQKDMISDIIMLLEKYIKDKTVILVSHSHEVVKNFPNALEIAVK